MNGKVALITGSAGGIGSTFADYLLKNGAKVAICDVNKIGVEQKVNELIEKYGKENVLGLTCDVTNDEEFEDSFKKTIKHFEKLDIVINNAGIANEKDKNWKKVIDINFKGVVTGTYLADKYLGKQHGGKGGTVINISSVSCLQAVPTLPVYSATKAAINQFSRSQGAKFLYDLTGLRVISIVPGFTANPSDQDNKDAKDIVIHPEEFLRFCSENWKCQSAENMGRGLIEVLNKAESGEIWTIENDEPAYKTTIS